MPRKTYRKCDVPECTKPTLAQGVCDMHYRRLRRHGDLHFGRVADWGLRERHPLYHSWRGLCQHQVVYGVCAEWKGDFWVFVRDVGDRPKHATLAILDKSKPYGPDNFFWRVRGQDPGLLKARGDKAAYMREWQRKMRATVVGRRRSHDASLKRHYGIRVEDYERMLEGQGGVCAICKRPETSVDPKTAMVRRLAVDHCHRKGGVRGLLCSNCNKALGSLRDDPEIVDAAAAYLRQHASA